MTDARQRSESSLPKERTTSVWCHMPSMRSCVEDPSGRSSIASGQTRSLVRSPVAGPTIDQSNTSGRPGRSRSLMARRRASPSSGSTSQRTRERAPATLPRTRASIGTAASTSRAPTA